MIERDFELLLLRTVFSCMASDQAIDAAEMANIQKSSKATKLFGDLDLKLELKRLEGELNAQGHGFFLHFLSELAVAGLSKNQELVLLRSAIEMVEANEEVEYSEIKFVKLIRSELKLTDEEILQVHPEFEEYLQQDMISDASKESLISQFFVGDEFPIIVVPDLGDN